MSVSTRTTTSHAHQMVLSLLSDHCAACVNGTPKGGR